MIKCIRTSRLSIKNSLSIRYGASSDGYDMVAPSGVGGEACMDIATAMADKSSYVRSPTYLPTYLPSCLAS